MKNNIYALRQGWLCLEGLGNPRLESPMLDPRAARALRMLNRVIDLTNGLEEPGGRARAVDYFEVLRSSGVEFTLDEVRDFCLHGLGLPKGPAYELADIADKVDARRSLWLTGNGATAPEMEWLRSILEP